MTMFLISAAWAATAMTLVASASAKVETIRRLMRSLLLVYDALRPEKDLEASAEGVGNLVRATYRRYVRLRG